MNQKVVLADHTEVPAIGQGTWYLGENRYLAEQEKAALNYGIKQGMTLIDTAEMYGSGKSEKLIGEVIAGYRREDLFIVSKVYPHNAGRSHIFKSCRKSLERLQTDYLDLYLLHWRGGIPLAETVACMEQLKKEGKIRRWGVSNFDTDDMEELWSVPGGSNCCVNQVLYHMDSRGIEYDLIPWMKEHKVVLMAYSPLAHDPMIRRRLTESSVLKRIAEKHHASVYQILIAFAMRDGNTIVIPKSSTEAHTRDNAMADAITLDDEDMAAINKAFPGPTRKEYLDML